MNCHKFRILLLLPGFFGLSLSAMEGDVTVWTRIEIKNANVSQQTFEANRDFLSAPEFGWNSFLDGTLLKRGDLYDTFYFPVDQTAEVEMVFVESDVFQDDIIHRFDVDAGNGVKTLRRAQDEFVLLRSETRPDSRSGADGVFSGAVSLKPGQIHSDSVSFNAGDMTDYYRASDAPAVVLLVREGDLDLETTADEPVTTDPVNPYLIAEWTSVPEKIRVRARPGAGGRYTIVLLSGPQRHSEVIERILTDASQKRSFATFRSAGETLRLFAPEESASFCRARIENPGRLRTACTYFLYPNGNDEDRTKIEGATSPDREFKDAVRALKEEFEAK